MKVNLPNVPLWVGMAGAWSQLLGAGGLGPGGVLPNIPSITCQATTCPLQSTAQLLKIKDKIYLIEIETSFAVKRE